MSSRRLENLMISALWVLDAVGLYLLSFFTLSKLPILSGFFWPLFFIGVLGLVVAFLFFFWVSRIVLRSSQVGWSTTGSVRFNRLTSLAFLALPLGVFMISTIALLLGAISLGKSLVLDGVFAVCLLVFIFIVRKEFSRKPEDVWWTREFQISVSDLRQKLELLAATKGFRIEEEVPRRKLPNAPIALFLGEREVAEVILRQVGRLLVRIRAGTSAEQLKSIFESAVRLETGPKRA